VSDTGESVDVMCSRLGREVLVELLADKVRRLLARLGRWLLAGLGRWLWPRLCRWFLAWLRR